VRRRKSARRYIAAAAAAAATRNKARSFLSTTVPWRKPEAEPKTTSTVIRRRREPRVVGRFFVWSLSGGRNDPGDPGPDKSRGRHLGESPSFVRVGKPARPRRKRGREYIGGINRVPIQAVLVTWPFWKILGSRSRGHPSPAAFESWATTLRE
jgi:hypothetical protein